MLELGVTPGLDVRYVRPGPLLPSGTWGSCAPSTGTITIESTPSLVPGSLFDIGFANLELGDCVEGSLPPVILTDGHITVLARQALESVCPGS